MKIKIFMTTDLRQATDDECQAVRSEVSRLLRESVEAQCFPAVVVDPLTHELLGPLPGTNVVVSRNPEYEPLTNDAVHHTSLKGAVSDAHYNGVGTLWILGGLLDIHKFLERVDSEDRDRSLRRKDED